MLKTRIAANESDVVSVLDESNQLVSIFYRTVQTAKKNR